MGQFWAVLVRMADRRECSYRKIVSRCREWARRVYYGAVFKSKRKFRMRRHNRAAIEVTPRMMVRPER
jgi:hypothetical protein